uniref:Uncharacterized protein n=1 Tax=Buteo japonicus TaxID=224669 RepID=A0A8B9ZCQ4_9AVES
MYKLPALNRRETLSQQQLKTDPSKATEEGSNDLQMQPLSTRYKPHPAQGMQLPKPAPQHPRSGCPGPSSAILF